MSSNKSFWEKTKASWDRGVDRREKISPGTKENMRANLILVKGVVKAHGIVSLGAHNTGHPSSSDTAPSYDSSAQSHGPRFGEEGTGGRYPQGVDSTTGQPVAQSSTGAPYEVNNPKVQVDPNNVNWTPPKFK